MYDADLTLDQISLLCEIAEFDPGGDVKEAKKGDLQVLLSKGYAEAKESHLGSGFRLTAKGVTFLGERGLGLNEA
jgi:hypothetical protein